MGPEMSNIIPIIVVGRAPLVALVVKNLPDNTGDIETWVCALGQEDAL